MSEKTYDGSVGDRLDRLPLSKFHTKFTLFVTGGEFIITFVLIGVGGLLDLVSQSLHLSTDIATYVMPTSFYAGMFIGTISFGRLADLYGRRLIYFFNLLIFGIGAIIAGLMSNYIAIAVFMVIAGSGVGAEIPLGDTYISETMTKENRGTKLAWVYTIAIISAPLGAFWLLEMSKWNLDYSWRVFLIALGAGALIFQAVRWRMKESPRWLESVGRYDEAYKLTTEIEAEVMKEKNIKSLPPVNKYSQVLNEKPKMRDLFDKKLRKNSVMVLIFQYAQSGVFFGFTALVPTILVDKGFSIVSTLLYTMIIYSGFVIGSIANIFYIDKIERKFGVVGFIILAGVFGIIFGLSNTSDELMIFGFLVAFFLWNMSNFFHQYQAEIFPTKLRGTGTGFGQSINALASASVPTLLILFVLVHGTLLVFSVLGILVAVVVVDIMLFGPKTSNKELEDIVNL
ncbi:MAG: MFS transporter [Thermoplasmatales archaeon]